MNFLYLNLVISLFFTDIMLLGIGIFVLFKGHKVEANRLFAFYTFSILGVFFFMLWAITTDNRQLSFFLFRLVGVSAFLVPSLFLHFIISFLELKGKRRLLGSAYLLSAFFGIMSFTPYMVAGVSRKLFSLYFFMNPGKLFIFAIIFYVICIIYCLDKLFKELRTTKDERRSNQLKYLFWSTVFGYIGGAANFFYIYDVFIPILMPFGTYLVGFYNFAVAYAIFKYQLMDITKIIKKTLIYSIIIALISGAIVGISFLNNWFVEHIAGFKPWIVPLVVAFVSFVIGRLFWAKAKEIDKIKYDFINVAVRKLKTPLARTKGVIEDLKEILEKEEEKKLIKAIEEADNRLIDLVDLLLNVSKEEVVKYVYKLEKSFLEIIARQIINNFQNQIKEKNINLLVNFEKNLPKINLDKARIGSVIQIFLENAIHYSLMAKGKIIVKIELKKNKLIFSVQDNGIGISRKDQSRIFSKFFRTHVATLADTEGTGIGLFLSKNIIENHNGKIGFSSKGENKGSTFWFSLPITD